MRANYKVNLNPSEVRKMVNEEYNKKLKDTYLEVAEDVVAQLMAVVLYTLNSNYGFGKKRLKAFKNNLESYFEIFSTGGFFGNGFSTENCIEFMKDKYDIDLAHTEVRIKNR